MFCIHNYLVGGCHVDGPDCPGATVEERIARWKMLHGVA